MSARIQHTRIDEVRGPLLVVGDVAGVGWDEVGEIHVGSGDVRHGVVVEVDRDIAVVEVFEGTAGIGTRGTRVGFSGAPMRIPVGEDWLGRVCNGRGEPLDGGPPIVGEETRDIAGARSTRRCAPRLGMRS